MAKKPAPTKSVETLKHDEAKRKNIPTAELQSVLDKEQQNPTKVRYPRNTDLDPQLVWRGKDDQDWSELVVPAPPLYIQEKVHAKALIDDLLRATRERKHEAGEMPADMFADFNGIPKGVDKTDFYKHDQNWSNRMILGDSLQVMASLAEREGLRGRVQCVYFDPPYGIKFNSNFQWSTTSRDVKDGSAAHITREPEQVKAFRDTWRDGIHSYLTYLRDRLTVMRDLLTPSGSIFVQISDENVHRVRAVMDEVFGDENFVNTIVFKKKSATYSTETVFDYLIWYCRDRKLVKVRDLYEARSAPEGESKFNTIITPDLVFHNVSKLDDDEIAELLKVGGKWARVNYPIVSQHPSDTRSKDFPFRGKMKECGANKQWRFGPDDGLKRLEKAERLFDGGGASLGGVVYWNDWNQVARSNIWDDIHGEKFPTYVVQTATTAVQRCILMTTDPGDLVLDPTCGSGTTAYVAEQWARRWITLDTSRVALALARARIMGARLPFYVLADSREGQQLEAELTKTAPSTLPARGDIRHGFVYDRVPHIVLKSIADNTEIDVIWEKWQPTMDELRSTLSHALGKLLEEWEVPRQVGSNWPKSAINAHEKWWKSKLARQAEINSSIAAKTEYEFLFDKPYDDKKKVRVAGPFTVESLSPHRVLGVNEDGDFAEGSPSRDAEYAASQSFAQLILENLKVAGVQQAHKEDRITFTSLNPWPGDLICGEGLYLEGTAEKRAAIFIGPEFGTVQRADLVAAAREAGDAGFDVLVACAFNFEAHTTEFNKLGRIPVLKARMNADLHMADDLKSTGRGNLFIIFGEPDIEVLEAPAGRLKVQVNGVDVFKPQTGEVISDGPEGIACWLLDTDYNEESFFVRQAYFLGAGDPYGALRSTLKTEIDADAWATLNSAVSRPFDRPTKGRIAVKVINHLGDEVMKVFKV
jgi:adenine-specific DNA-methyltransferase